MHDQVWGSQETQFFFQLDPNLILHCIDLLGFRTTGRCLTLNSMENRVYEIEVEKRDNRDKTEFIVAKFYRPGRWSRDQILDEHSFLLELLEEELPVIAPMKFDGETLFKVPDHNLWYTIFPKKGGRIPDEMNKEKLEITGRLLGRVYNVGSRVNSKHRLEINPKTFGTDNLNVLLDTNFLASHLVDSFKKVVEQVCELSTPMFQGVKIHRIHGDCHRSNIIYREFEGPYLIDFDDMLMGPAIQDIWLIVPGSDQEAIADRDTFLKSYEIMREFDYSTLRLIEPLRALRYINFATWMAKRWDDPAFKNAFPYFGTDEYWSTLINDLHMQVAKIQGNILF